MKIEERLNMGGGAAIFVPTSQFGCFCQCLWFQGEADQLELGICLQNPAPVRWTCWGGGVWICAGWGGGGAGQGEGPGQVLQEGTESVTSAMIRCLEQPRQSDRVVLAYMLD